MSKINYTDLYDFLVDRYGDDMALCVVDYLDKMAVFEGYENPENITSQEKFTNIMKNLEGFRAIPALMCA